MSSKFTRALPCLLLVASTAVFADEGTTDTGYYQQQQAEQLSDLSKYLLNLGKYFGYDITQYCASGGTCTGSGSTDPFVNTLFNANGNQTLDINLFNSYVGSLIAGGTNTSTSYNPLVPSGMETYGVLNTLAGQTYITPPYSAPSDQGGGVSVSSIIDQQTYQSDPVSQALLNIISTPDVSYCTTTTSSGQLTINKDCQTLYREQIMAAVIGPLQKTNVAFTPANNIPLVQQLNSDMLLNPLLYTTTASQTNSTSSSTDTQNTGLPAQSQAQIASNFIRYVISAVSPLALPSYANYDKLVSTALNFSGQSTVAEQMQAQIVLLDYLTKLRVYTAQTSVAIGNLYYIMARRLPQEPVSGNGNPTSAALNEFTMATWRLYNPKSDSEQWISQINKGSSASVQKEMAILLAEINYQLYLSRQQQERMLLTQSIMLLQNGDQTQPKASSLDNYTKKSGSMPTSKQ